MSGASIAAAAAADAAAVPSAAPDAVAPPPAEPAKAVARPRRVYESGVLRKTALSFAFLYLLPFFGSLGPMALQRVTHSPVDDLIGFALMALAFTALMVLIVFELLVSIRSRVELGDRAIRFTLPKRGGLVLAFSYGTHEIPYDQIAHAEVWREIYGGSLAPVMLKGARLVTTDGQKITLGFVSEANEDAVIPFPVIAEEIAQRIGKPVIDRGSLHRSVGARGAAEPVEPTPISDAEIAQLNRSHNRVMLGLIGCLLVLVAAGIARDIVSETVDHGERATNAAPKKKG
ncbi:MAG: hypothetical protein ACOYLQ_17925 [Hyphomicrobiaceae bacterium]